LRRTIAACLGLLTFLWASTNATAFDLVGVTEVTLSWTAATGPVQYYGVFVARNGAAPSELPEQFVPGNTATVSAAVGDVLTVQVAGYDAAGARGPLSDWSEPMAFLAAPSAPTEEPTPSGEPEPAPTEDPGTASDPAGETASPLLYSESFEAYGDGEDPLGWLDTGEQSSLVEEPALFETVALADGTTAFGTVSELTDIHSHLELGNSLDWSSYEFSGELAVDHPRAGIGVTLYSDYPQSDTYYRLRRHGGKSFQLAPHADGRVACEGRSDSGVVPEAGHWYRFRFQAHPDGGGTRLRAKLWPKQEPEPVLWQIDCVDAVATFEAGTPGVWATGRGTKLWDAFEVATVAPEDAPAYEPTTNDGAAGAVLYAEAFEAYGAGEDPLGWVDTGGRSSLLEDPTLFETVALRDGTMAFGTASRETSIHSHLLLGDAARWSAYEFSGRLAIDLGSAGIGVTLYSDYPDSDRYYRLSRRRASSFQLEPHGDTAITCLGRTDSSVVPDANVWYRFRFRALPEGSGTRLQANVWAGDRPEPEGWQIDCLDPDGTYQSGVPGLWSTGRGRKLWDELEVFAIGR